MRPFDNVTINLNSDEFTVYCQEQLRQELKLYFRGLSSFEQLFLRLTGFYKPRTALEVIKNEKKACSAPLDVVFVILYDPRKTLVFPFENETQAEIFSSSDTFQELGNFRYKIESCTRQLLLEYNPPVRQWQIDGKDYDCRGDEVLNGKFSTLQEYRENGIECRRTLSRLESHNPRIEGYNPKIHINGYSG